MARLDPKLGLLVPLRGEVLAPIGVGTFESSYTQVGVGPGVAVGDAGDESWSPVVTGAQDAPVDLRAVKGGYPARGDGATFIARAGADTAATDWHGWSEPNLITGWSSPADYQAANWTVFAAARRSDTGEIVVVGVVTGDTNGRAWSYHPRTEAWTTRFDFAAAGVPLLEPVAMAEDPDTPGRILLWSGDGSAETVLAYFSDDTGATWQVYALGTHTSLSGVTRSSVGVHPARDWLLLHGTTQLASADRGVTWQTVESITAELTGSNHSIAVGPRGYAVAYLRDTDSQPCVRVLSTGFSPFSAAAEVVLVAESCESVVVACDDDGILYAYVWRSSTSEGHVRCLRSLNGGFTWGAYTTQVAGRASNNYGRIFPDAAVFSLGKCHVFGDIDGAANALAMMQLGGWSNVDQGNSFEGTSAAATSRFGWSQESVGSGERSTMYIPADLPANSGWTATGAGTDALSSGGLTVTTVVNTRIYEWVLKAGAASSYLCGHWRGVVASGEARSSSSAFTINVDIMDGVTGAIPLNIRIGNNGIQVRGLTTLETDVSMTTSAPFEIRWFLRRSGSVAFVTVWTRIVGAGTKWTRVTDDSELSERSGALTNNRIRWGVLVGAGGNVVTTMLCGAALDCDWRFDLNGLDDVGISPITRVRGIVVGKAMPPSGARYPVPQLSSTGVGYVHGIRGPVYTGEQFDVPPGYEFAVQHLDPLEEPSPVVSWRATGTTLFSAVFDAGVERWRGGAFALVALRASFRTATLAVDDGVGGFTTLGTLDKGWAIEFARVGNRVQPAGAPTIARYFHEDELAGGYVVLPTAGLSVARRIVANSAGYWGAAEQPAVRITVEGIDGSELTSGAGELVAPSGVLVVYPTSELTRRYLRVQIPAAQIVPADRGEDGLTAAYDAGKLFPARVLSAGLDPTWAVPQSVLLPASVTRQRDGSPLMTRTGPARRTVGYQWPAVPAHPLRDRLATNRNHMAASGGVPIGAEGDPWSVMPRVVDALDGDPLVLVPRLPAAAATLTDPTTFLYGLALAPALSLTQSGGQEGTDEVLAVGGLQVEELT